MTIAPPFDHRCFADLVGSTSLYERLGDAAASRFATELVGLLRQVFAKHQGRVVKLLGYGLVVMFASQSDALAASMQIQKKLLDAPLQPAGMEPPIHLIEGDCFGNTVSSAARLADLAGGRFGCAGLCWRCLPAAFRPKRCA